MSAPSSSRPQNLISIGFILVCVFTFMMVAFNRGFAYNGIDVGPLPLFVTEAYLALISLIMIFSREARDLLWKLPYRNRLTLVVLGMLALVFAKLLYRLELDVYALRHSALGYYLVFALITYVFTSNPKWRQRFSLVVMAGTLLTCVVMLIVRTIDIDKFPILFTQYQGVGAFLWVGLVSLFLLGQAKVDFWKTPKPASAFLFLVAFGFVTGVRSYMLGMLLCSILTLILIRKKITKTMIFSLVIVLVTSFGFFALRKNNVIKFKNQDIWHSTWSSWGELAQIKFGEEEKERKLAKAEGAKRRVDYVQKVFNVPQNKNQERQLKLGIPLFDFETEEIDDIYYKYQIALKNGDPIREILQIEGGKKLILMSPFLGPTFADRAYSSKTNNMFWRLELWRLAITATFLKSPLTGFPLGVNVMFWAFSPHNYVNRTDMHNSHLAYFFRFGLIGLAIYLFLILRVLWDLRQSFKQEKNFQYVACGIGVVYLVIMSSFNVILEGPYGAYPLWGLIGYSFALCQDKN